MRLSDIGERRIIHELIKPRFPLGGPSILISIGDDCAAFRSPPNGHIIVVTADECPHPIVCSVTKNDYYHHGRLTALVNVSDLAAMGASPLGLLVSTVMPSNMLVEEYERFLDGLQDACHEWDCPVIGGNIKDGDRFVANATAFGHVPEDQILRRTGASLGDRVLVIGNMGVFMSALLALTDSEIKICAANQYIADTVLFRPRALITEGIALAAKKLATTCMDASDGIFSALFTIMEANGVDLVLEADGLDPHPLVVEIAPQAAIDPLKLMLAWGDWQLVITAAQANIPPIRDLLRQFDASVHDIGTVCEGNGTVWLHRQGIKTRLNNLGSERFSQSSIFSSGLERYIEYLRTEPISC